MDVDLALSDVPAFARRAEALGYGGLCVPEAVHDGTLVALLALEHTTSLHVLTGVLVAFARSPMLVAQNAWDLQRMSGGRFELGLGSQVRGNIVGRFGMPWAPPAPRMRDYVRALRAIFECWQTEGPLHFESEHYRLTRMQPFFQPGPLETRAIPIAMGAVNPRMTKVAGEVADVLLTHPTNSAPRYLREITRPALDAGANESGREPVRLIVSPLVATGPEERDVASEQERIRELLCFLYSTPAYWPTLVHHGWGEVGEELHRLSREGRWEAMRGAITEEMLAQLVPAAPFDAIVDVVREWYGDVADGVVLRMPADSAQDGAFGAVVKALRESASASGGRA